jgi:hypothetical protein
MEGTPNEYTPEEKAKLQQSRTLSDADLIKGGAVFIPSSNGEPVLNVTEGQKLGIKEKQEYDSAELLWRKSPESLLETQKLAKILEKIKVEWIDHTFPLILHSIGYTSGRAIKISSNDERTYVGYHYYREDGMSTVVIIDRRGEYPHSVVKCYSLQEFYNNLRPEEKEKGVALGKKLESYLDN